MRVVPWRDFQETAQLLNARACLLNSTMAIHNRQERLKLLLGAVNGTPAGVQFIIVWAQTIVDEIEHVRAFKHVSAYKLINVHHFFHTDGLIENLQRGFIWNPEQRPKSLRVSGKTFKWLESSLAKGLFEFTTLAKI